ncbi:hypothetical protein KSP39_PZI014102 [Platanthera zijinensis]|uniref:Uncharacterized protein n=1 Tax=Platanthera zijinensis TaxID=2320716 RepID=A0AAP0BBD3_9ASPA
MPFFVNVAAERIVVPIDLFSAFVPVVFIPSVNSGTSSPNINGAVVALSPVFPSDGSVGQRDRKLGKRESKHLLQAMHSHLAKTKENMCLAQLRKGLESRGLSYPLTVLPFLLLLRANVPKQYSRDKGALH